MAKELSLGKLTVLYAIGNFTSKIVGLLLFFVYTYFLTEKSIGYLDLIITTIGWLTPIISLQLSEAVLRWTISSDEEYAKVASGSILIVAVNSVVFFILYALGAYLFNFKLDIVIFIFIITQTIYPIVLQFARGTGNNKTYIVAGVLYSILYTALSLIALIGFKSGIVGLIISNILSTILTIGYISYKVKFLTFLRYRFFDFQFTRKMLEYALPLIPNTLSWWAISTIDRYIVLFYLGAAFNGLFAVGMKLPTILLMITNIFALAWQEKGIKAFNDKSKDVFYSKVFDDYFTLLFSLIFVLIAVSKPILLFIVPTQYFEAWKFIPILYFAVGFQSLSAFYGIGYVASKKTKGALTTTIYGTVVTIILNVALVPVIGLIGSSIAMFAGYFCMFIVRVIKTKEFFKIDLPVKKMIMLIAISIAFGVINISDNLYILVFSSILSVFVFISFNLTTIKEFLSRSNLIPRTF